MHRVYARFPTHRILMHVQTYWDFTFILNPVDYFKQTLMNSEHVSSRFLLLIHAVFAIALVFPSNFTRLVHMSAGKYLFWMIRFSSLSYTWEGFKIHFLSSWIRTHPSMPRNWSCSTQTNLIKAHELTMWLGYTIFCEDKE